MLAYVRTYGVDALITRGANTYGPRQYPEKFLPLFITNAFDGRARCRCTATASSAASGCTSTTTAPAIELALRKGARGRRLQRRRPGAARTWRSCAASSTSPARAPTSSATSRTARATTAATRVDSTKLRDLGWAPQHSFDAGGLEETVEWYRAQPRLVGADQSQATTGATTTSSTRHDSATVT